MDKNNRINQILLHLADAASQAADEMSDAVQNAGQAVGEKYDELMAKVEIKRLSDEQNKLFADIGRTMYLLQSGVIAIEEGTADNEAIDAQQTIERLLLLADQKQQEIDAATEKLHKLSGEAVCPVCSEVADGHSVFCKYCGAKIKA